MLRIATLLLCILLAAAAAGRYRAEVSVREARDEINRLQVEKEDETRRIQVLRAELAWLESPERLAKIAKEQTQLVPVSGRQIIGSAEFISVFSNEKADVQALRLSWSTNPTSEQQLSQNTVLDNQSSKK